MRQYESYRCKQCGNVVEVTHVGGGELHCCGEAMECVTTDLTLVNLMKAVAGESMARNKYEFYAKVAQKEGYGDIAAHFQRAADNEKMHAKLEFKLHNLQKNGAELGDTAANLQDAIDGESYENLTMYPDFAKVAEAEGNKAAAALFKKIGAIEVEHEKMYRELLERLTSAHEFEDDEEVAWICEVCGHVHYGKKAPKVCPVCKHPQGYQSRMIDRK